MASTDADVAFERLREAFFVYDTEPTRASAGGAQRPPPPWTGYLKDIRSLPMDVLFEPVDLLFLARSSREFRALLMSKNTAFIWSAARHNIPDLPPCPSFLSEPAYANLVFRPECYRCKKGRSRVIMWEYRARYCRRCIDRVTTKERSLESQLPMAEGLTDCHKLFCIVRASPNHSLADKRAHNLDIKKFLEIWEHTTVADRDQLRIEQEKLCQEITEFSLAGRTWAETSREQAAVQRLAAEETRTQRLHKILEELGWKETIDGLEYPRRQTFTSILRAGAQESQDAVALKRAEMRAVRYLEQVKILRRRFDHVHRYAKRLGTMKLAILSFRRHFGPAIFPLFPRYYEFTALPEVEQIITSPLNQVITLDAFSCLAPMMPRYLADWRHEKVHSLEALIRYNIDSELPEDVHAVDLAVGQFLQCGVCDSVVDTQRSPFHQCYEPQLPFSGRSDYELAVKQATKSSRDIHFRPLTDFLQNLLEQCGQDYRRATAQEMDELEIFFCCRRCKPDYWTREAREVLNWRAAVHHAFDMYLKARRQYHCVLEIMPEDHPVFSVAKNVYSVANERNPSAIGPLDWICGYCVDSYSQKFYTFEDAQMHVLRQHGVEDPVEHSDFFYHFDQPCLPRRSFLYHQSPLQEADLEPWDRASIAKGFAALVDLSDMIET